MTSVTAAQAVPASSVHQATPATSMSLHQQQQLQMFQQMQLIMAHQQAQAAAATPTTTPSTPAAAAHPNTEATPVAAGIMHHTPAIYQAQAYTTPQADRSSKNRDEDDGSPLEKRAKWSAQEDDMLKSAVQSCGGRNWKKIAQSAFGGQKTDVQCLHRWQKVLDPKLVKGPWTAAEDARVLALVSEHGPQKWSLIASHLPGRIGKQCRERWHNHLNPNIKKEQWTPEEDQIILTLHQTLGSQWAVMTRYLPGRPDNAIKNRWHSSMKRKYVAQPVTTDANGMINLPGLGLVALPKPGDRGRESDDEGGDDDDDDRPKKKGTKRKGGAPGSSIKVKKELGFGADGEPLEESGEGPPVSAKKKLTKRQEAASASKASAKKASAVKKEPGSAPAKSRAGKKAAAVAAAVAAPRTSTRPQRSSAQKSWADLGAETETEDSQDEMDDASPVPRRTDDDSEGEDAEMLETAAQASRRGVRRGIAMGPGSESESESDRELAPAQLMPATPAHRRSGTATSFLATPQLRTPARGRSSISPGLLGNGHHHTGMNGHDGVHGVNSTPLRLSSPSAALSLASPSTQLMSPGVNGNVFSSGGPNRLRPLSTPLTNNQARFHNMMAPRTPASPSHGLLHPSSAINSMMSHLSQHNGGGAVPSSASGIPATPSSRMLSMSMGLHLMSSPGPSSASYLNTPSAVHMHAGVSSTGGHDDALSSSANVGGAALQRDHAEDDAHHQHLHMHIDNGKKLKTNPLASLSSPSPFINLSNRPLLQTPLLRYGLQTPGFNGNGTGTHTATNSVAPPISGSGASPGFESFFQSPVRLLNRTASQRGKRGLDFPTDASSPGVCTPVQNGAAAGGSEAFLNSPPPLHAQAPMDATAPASAAAASTTPPSTSPVANKAPSMTTTTTTSTAATPPLHGMGAASVQQLLSHLQSQAASMDPSTPSSVSMPSLTTSPAITATPSTASTVRSERGIAATPMAPSTTAPMDADAPISSTSATSDSIPRFDQSEIDSMEVAEPKGKFLAPPTAQESPMTPAHKKSTRNGRRTQEIMGSPLLAFATLC